MKKNKPLIGLLVAAVLAFFLFHGKDNDEEWTPASAKKKGKKADYSELRKNAFASVEASALPDLPQKLNDPFKSRQTQSGGNAQAKAVKRTLVLKGIMRNTPLFAVILDETGESHVVKAGDAFKGVSVTAVTLTSVTLKDPYGTFTLTQK